MNQNQSSLSGIRTALLFGLAILLLPWPTLAAIPTPEPEEGQWARSTLALLHYNRNLCQGIADQVLGRWRQLPADAEQQIRDFVLNRAGTDLAAARATSDLIRKFERGTRAESGAIVSGSLRKLYDLQIELCDTVAFPRAPRSSFEGTLQDLNQRISLEEEELGLHLLTEPGQLEALLEDFLLPIQMASIEAEGEYVDYIDSITPKPKPPTATERMHVWYKTYAPAVAPAKNALGQFLRGRQASNSAVIMESCRSLSVEVLKVLAQPNLFRSIDPTVNRSLQRAYEELKLLAGQCVAGRFDQVDQHMAKVQRYLRQAAVTLKKYELRP